MLLVHVYRNTPIQMSSAVEYGAGGGRVRPFIYGLFIHKQALHIYLLFRLKYYLRKTGSVI